MGHSENELAILRLVDRQIQMNRRLQSLMMPWVTTSDGAWFLTEPFSIPVGSDYGVPTGVPLSFKPVFDDGNEAVGWNIDKALPTAIVDRVPKNKRRWVTLDDIEGEDAELKSEEAKILGQPVPDDVDDMAVDQLEIVSRESRRYLPKTVLGAASQVTGIVPQALARASARTPRRVTRRRRAAATARSPGRSSDPDEPAPRVARLSSFFTLLFRRRM